VYIGVSKKGIWNIIRNRMKEWEENKCGSLKYWLFYRERITALQTVFVYCERKKWIMY